MYEPRDRLLSISGLAGQNSVYVNIIQIDKPWTNIGTFVKDDFNSRDCDTAKSGKSSRAIGREGSGDGSRQTMLRINPEVAKALRGAERDVLNEIEDYLGSLDIASDPLIFQEQFDFAFV